MEWYVIKHRDKFKINIIMAMTMKKAVLCYVTSCNTVDIQGDSGDDNNCHCKTQSSYEYVQNYEWLPRSNYLTVAV